MQTMFGDQQREIGGVQYKQQLMPYDPQ